jgi:hypothetical protein
MEPGATVQGAVGTASLWAILSRPSGVSPVEQAENTAHCGLWYQPDRHGPDIPVLQGKENKRKDSNKISNRAFQKSPGLLASVRIVS